MDKNLEMLLQVQDWDLRIHKLQQQIDSVPEEKAAVEAQLAATEAETASMKRAFIEVEKSIKTVELDIDKVKTKIIDLQQKSLSVKKNEEYRALMKEIDNCKGQIAELEEKELVFMEQLEAAKKERVKADRLLEQAKARIAGSLEDLEVRARNCGGQIDKVKASRDGLLEQLPAETLKLYRRLAGKNTGKIFRKAVVPVIGNTCGGCNLSITPYVRNQVRKRQLVTCENCGSILYAE